MYRSIEKDYGHSFDSAHDAYQRINRQQLSCQEILNTRQEQRATGHAGIRSEPIPDIQSYLYQDLDTTYPIISDALNLLEELETIQREVEWALARFD